MPGSSPTEGTSTDVVTEPGPPSRPPGRRPKLFRDTALEKRRRTQRALQLVLLSGLVGLAGGATTADEVGVAPPIWFATCTVLSILAALVALRVESVVRIRMRVEGGDAQQAVSALTDALVGAVVALPFGYASAAVLPVALSGALFAGAGVLWRGVEERLGLAVVPAADSFMDAEDYSAEQALFSQGRVDEALDALDRRAAAQPEHPGPRVMAGHLLRDQGDYQRAVDYYSAAFDVPNLDPNRGQIFTRWIWEIARTHLTDPALATRALEELVGRYPDAREVDWAWRELTVGMSVAVGDEEDDYGAHSGHVPAVKAVERVLSGAFVANASDVHVEEFGGGLRVRYRIDGVLEDVDAPPDRLRGAVLARLRVMAGLNPASSPVPEDARMRIPFGGRVVNIRVSTVPTLYGESIAMRILDTGAEIRLGDIGLGDSDAERLERIIRRPHGMVLTTGPGGSGKSTTLHAIVKVLSTGREKICTVEDPVEYAMDGVSQVSVNQKAGLTFASALRSLVRQDPDVLLVGEIRDGETAEIATHAALTGHLVLSTLHTTDALSALHRLVDMGVPDYLVVHMLEAVAAQRLVRKVCEYCAVERPPSDQELDELGVEAASIPRVTIGEGCERCRETGYRGRTGLFELLLVDEDVREGFLRRSDRRDLMAAARASGMRTLREDGLVKVAAGVTTPAEVARVT